MDINLARESLSNNKRGVRAHQKSTDNRSSLSLGRNSMNYNPNVSFSGGFRPSLTSASLRPNTVNSKFAR
jgi:hypothetical protein